MAKNITLMGANYPDVPAVVLPKTGGGSATFVDADIVSTQDYTSGVTVPTGFTKNGSFTAKRAGNIVVLNGSIRTGNSEIAGIDALVCTLPSGCRPSVDTMVYLFAYYGTNGYTFVSCNVKTNGQIVTAYGSATIAADKNIEFASTTFAI